ncbi:unnamed protein product [Dovyalis caffra]|uniref:Uncharacterized protein n=1 Tax=Dovyalis caffra TaxID=77055 RepID=A0AAV1QS94_9ROSI|nr:unnamed protein product [Dovyalis caffra]
MQCLHLDDVTLETYHHRQNWQLVACLMIEAFPVEALNSIQHLNGSVGEMEHTEASTQYHTTLLVSRTAYTVETDVAKRETGVHFNSKSGLVSARGNFNKLFLTVQALISLVLIMVIFPSTCLILAVDQPGPLVRSH